MEPITNQLTTPSPHTSRSGVALLIVLGFLVLITVVAVAFLSSVTTEQTTATSAAAGASGKELADSSVQLVIGQIRQATAQGPNVAWASQPGMIRTYGSGTAPYTASSNPLAYYKLYSSDNMVVDGTYAPTNDVPTTWSSRPALFTDLNAPVAGATVTNYPILDPTSLATPTTAPAGFFINNAPTTGTANLAPMPVKWIYVLRDGTLTAPVDASSTATVADFTTAPAGKIPTPNNPIVGRMAFWTDDETCKVNINTASEGTYWDMPRASGTDEMNLGSYQPAQHEWQRYPGHPAMTSLSAVFPTLSATQIYSLVPRINGGGSSAGTVTVNTATAITAKTDRLYASVDELIFNPSHGGTDSAGLTKTQVEQAKFFLTAHSRAPEVNLFGQPRIACWPIYNGLIPSSPANTYWTAFDKLIAFCSTINGQAYYFQRQNASSPSADITLANNSTLYSYLQNLTSTSEPGFGASLSSKYPLSYKQILTEIFDYIRSTDLLDDNLPNANRYTSNNNTSGSGWVTPSAPTTGPAAGTMGFGRAFTLSSLNIGFIANAAGDTNSPAAIASNTTDNPAIIAASTAIIAANGTNSGGLLTNGQTLVQALVFTDCFSVMQGWSPMTGNMRITISGLSNLMLNSLPLYATDTETIVCNSWGVIDGRNWGGAESWRYFLQQNNLLPPISTSILITNPTMPFSGGQITVTLSSPATNAVTPANTYQTFTLNLPAAPALPIPTITSIGTLGNGNGGDTPPTVMQNWWSFTNTSTYQGRLSANSVTTRPGMPNLPPPADPPADINHELRMAGAVFREEYDVVRGIVLKHGDFRVVAAQQTVSDPSNLLYQPLSDYGTTNHISCQLSDPYTWLDLFSTVGGNTNTTRRYFMNLPSGSGYPNPYIYPGASGVNLPEGTGDFDNGLADAMDGAYINKPDEGNILGTGNYLGVNAPYFYQTWGMTPGGTNLFSPNRMMPSPGMFGSLPSMIIPGNPSGSTPWRTLLFRPQGADFAGQTYLKQHPSTLPLGTPPDHLFMDLFWMPVVEPYAISEPFSTAGKVNMNFQMVPFTYIERSTALRAVFKSEKLGAILNSDYQNYKNLGNPMAHSIRLEIDVNNAASPTLTASNIPTLSQFATNFAAGGLYKSASEICDLHIVPTGQTVAGMPAFWNTHQITGGNLRDRIYTTLYPRLTTKSNSFTVHFRVQVLKKVPSTNVAQWVETTDKLASEYRGSSLIERYIDPSDPTLPDFATTPAASLDANYKFRVVSTKKFSVE